jgi:hypothetical protein
MHEFMNIKINGCVAKQGSFDIPLNATVGDAVHVAGGFSGQGMQPTGVISIRSRRQRDGKYYCRRRLNYKRNPEHLKIKLFPYDLIVVQFKIDS